VEVAAAEPGGSLYAPRLAVGAGGTLHVVLAAFRRGTSDPRHLHARRTDGTWSTPAEVLPSAGARDSEVESAADDAARVHAVWKAADGTYRHAVLR
jgi:hypothetical protein